MTSGSCTVILHCDPPLPPPTARSPPPRHCAVSAGVGCPGATRARPEKPSSHKQPRNTENKTAPAPNTERSAKCWTQNWSWAVQSAENGPRDTAGKKRRTRDETAVPDRLQPCTLRCASPRYILTTGDTEEQKTQLSHGSIRDSPGRSAAHGPRHEPRGEVSVPRHLARLGWAVGGKKPP